MDEIHLSPRMFVAGEEPSWSFYEIQPWEDDETPDDELSSDDENVVTNDKPSRATKYCLIPGHTKIIDTEYQVPVRYILDDPHEEWSAGLNLYWVDESEDAFVDNMVCLIHEGFAYRKEMFKFGLTANDLARMGVEKKLKEKEAKEKTIRTPSWRCYRNLGS
ncbi:hypothetical protein Bca101_060431 [Brassica carinata]